ncbi:MAG: hypothetical protein ACKOE6_15955 [Flammeovirgaceae bacterium]
MAKLPSDGMAKHTNETKPNANSMARLYPMRVIYDATKKETPAMLRSLNAS